MPRIADFLILDGADGFVLRTGRDIDREIDFTVPSNTVLGARSVLTFTVDTNEAENLTLEFGLNNTGFRDLYAAQMIFTNQRVFGANILKTGTRANEAFFRIRSGSGVLRIANVVLWFQADV